MLGKKKRMQAYQGYLQKIVEKKQAKMTGNYDYSIFFAAVADAEKAADRIVGRYRKAYMQEKNEEKKEKQISKCQPICHKSCSLSII